MIFDKYAPIKKKVLRGNAAPFMTKGLGKAIMNRSKLTKWPSDRNIDILSSRLVKASGFFRNTRIFIIILAERQKHTTFPKLLQKE